MNGADIVPFHDKLQCSSRCIGVRSVIFRRGLAWTDRPHGRFERARSPLDALIKSLTKRYLYVTVKHVPSPLRVASRRVDLMLPLRVATRRVDLIWLMGQSADLIQASCVITLLVSLVVLSPVKVVVVYHDGKFRIIDTATPRLERNVQHRETVYHVAWLPEGGGVDDCDSCIRTPCSTSRV